MRRPLVAAMCLLGLASASPAAAYWQAGGAGLGSAATDVLPAGNQPSAAADVRTVTVSWTQTTFHATRIGSYSSGGYRVLRYPADGGPPVTPGAGCAGVITGSAATLSCQETGVAIGSWKYTVQPVLGTWSGGQSPLSTAAVTTVPPPTFSAASPQNPTAAQSTGDVALSWTAVAGASGYNVYRRTAAGSYNYSAPLNGATPLSGTTYTDSGGGLASGTGYAYVVRAVQASPAAESPNSNELTVTPWSRPSAPGAPTATPGAGASIEVSWTAASGATGYNVYRRKSTASYNYAAPLNGATPVSGTSYTDSTATKGTTYFYVVRGVNTGAGGATLESASSAESAAVTADSVAPPTPTSVTVGASAGPLLSAGTCGYASKTRFVNAAGRAAVPVTIQISAPEAGETVVLTATTPGSTAVTATLAATSTSVTATLDLSTLLDGTVTLTAQTSDAAGNLSATRSPATATVKDTAAALSALVYTDNKTTSADTIAGTSECGARITATQTAGPSVGSSYPAKGTFTVGTKGTFTAFAVGAIKGSTAAVAYGYNVTSTDLAGNAATLALSGTDVK